ncbi:hypothetical protein FZI91_11675 [Mycobacterium sp. CBMA271]|uniref:hypothetical protein n=1 Tax=unclassified Mycobacteroides TaxID=2618759 RepID=UPI0012DC082B|nr:MULTISPECIES: hypothetical protein [unclassified Mycobacteroides]MUM16145.1 hypothetical protein [Mycobacteroides sp. CBMA 326]MUM22353.1 hypothetical protein [Mycobacteroides sp. CBMA 271]
MARASRAVSRLAAALLGIALVGQSTTAIAAPTDEQQIRGVVAGELAALKEVDGMKFASYVCEKYRAKVEAEADSVGQPPPLDIWPSGADYDTIYDALTTTFKGVSKTALKKVARAIVDQDQDAYRAAWREVWKELWAPLRMRIEKITISGDTAIASVTASGLPDVPASTSDRSFAREADTWKDCDDSVYGDTGPRLRLVPDAIVDAPGRLANAISAPR